MMGERSESQGQFFYRFNLEDVVPSDVLLRKIDTVLDLSSLRSQLAPHYSHTGRPSIDPDLMIRMLLIGYCYGVRSERRNRVAIARELLVAYTGCWAARGLNTAYLQRAT